MSNIFGHLRLVRALLLLPVMVYGPAVSQNQIVLSQADFHQLRSLNGADHEVSRVGEARKLQANPMKIRTDLVNFSIVNYMPITQENDFSEQLEQLG